MQIKNNAELFAYQRTDPKENNFKPYLNSKDPFQRNIVHQLCIFGNLEKLKELVKLHGNKLLCEVDKFNTNCAHFAGKNLS